MAGGKDTVSSNAPAAASVRVSTATYGRAIPRLYGKNRIQVNTIWTGDFKSTEHKSTQDAGGKGGSGTTTNISYTYSIALAMAVCSGVTTGVDKVWVGKSKGDLSTFGFSYLPGTDTQSAFGYITTNHPDEALAYRGTSYIASGLFDLGGDASIPQVTVEATGPLSGVAAGSVTTGDVNVASVVYDLLTAVDAVGIPSGKVGSMTDMQNFCQASKILVSPVYLDQEPASDIIKRLLTIANTGVTYSDGVLKFAPLADSSFTDNGATFTANTTAVYDLTDDDFLGAGSDDPVTCDRVSPANAKNKITVKFLNRALDYADDVAEAKDRASIEQSGEHPEDPITFKEICDADVAHVVADHIKNRSVYIRNTYEFKLGWRFALLEPLDIVTITDEGLGLIKAPVRILEIEEDEDGGLSVKAEELPSLTLTGTRYPVPVSSGTGIDYNITPGNANTPVIFEPPIALSGAPEAWIATSGGADWGGCDVWISTDNDTYARAGRITGNSRHGVLSATLASGAALDTVNTLAVDLSVSRSTLAPGTAQNATDLVTLCYVDGELLAYRDATLTGSNQYNLGYLVRGAYGTPIGSHASASKFIRLDGGVFKYTYSPDMIGRTIYVKLQSFNQFQGGIQDLGSISATSFTLSGAPVADVTGLALEQPFTGTSVAIKWDRTPGALGYTVEVWSTVLERTVNVGDVTRFAYSWEDALADGGPFRDLTFKVKANSANGVSSTQAQLVVNNPVPAALSGLLITPGYQTVFFQCDKPVDPDFAGIQVWLSTSSTFTPGSNKLVYDGPDVFAVINKNGSGVDLVSGTTYYIKAAAYDVFGKTSLNISSSMSVTPVGVSSGIGAGEITNAMIAALAASKITGQMTDAQIADLAAAKVTGQITGTQITNDAITTPKIAAGAVTTSQLAAGAVTANEIAAHAVTTAKLAAGAVTANEIAANTITAAKIAANTITATEVAAASITGDRLVSNTVTAAQIAAATITATELSAGSVTTAKIAAGAVTANEIAAGTITTDRIVVGAASSASSASYSSVDFYGSSSTTLISGQLTMLTMTTTGSPLTIGGNIQLDFDTATNIAYVEISVNAYIDSTYIGNICYDKIPTPLIAGNYTFKQSLPISLRATGFGAGSHNIKFNIDLTFKNSSGGSVTCSASHVRVTGSVFAQENKV